MSASFASDIMPPLYRPCAGMFLLNRRGAVFVGRRKDAGANESGRIDKPWQMLQGGIDAGEAPADAALREMLEEIGTANATILGESRQWHCYDLPAAIAASKWGGKYRGQAQKWFALRFDGADNEINVATAHPEFNDWKWASVEEVCDLVVAFKRDVYVRITEEFYPFVQELRQPARS